MYLSKKWVLKNLYVQKDSFRSLYFVLFIFFYSYFFFLLLNGLFCFPNALAFRLFLKDFVPSICCITLYYWYYSTF